MASTPLSLDPKTTALVLIDLQRGIVARETKPHASADVVANAAKLARRFREVGATVVLVNVAFASDGADRLKPQADAPMQASAPQPGWSDIVDELEPSPSDLRVTKKNWGAFYGTDLDLQLRRRGIRTIVLGGIASNFGVESTARDAYERAYEQLFVEDAMATMAADWHTFVVTNIFPRMGRVRSTADVLGALA